MTSRRSTIGLWLAATTLLAASCGAGEPTTADDTIDAAATADRADEANEPTTGPASTIDAPGTPTSSAVNTIAPTLGGELTATILDTHPHDSDAFTQGLEIIDGRFIEGTGLRGQSDRRLVDIETGEPSIVVPLEDELFGEGLTIVGDEVLQLTWQAGVLIRSNATTLEETSRQTYQGEGWGLCYDGGQLVMSNGSAELSFRDPTTFELISSVEVTLDGAPVELLNELECVNGQVLANIWQSDLIVVIDPESGDVVATLDASGLRPDSAPFEESAFALNGIAYDPSTGNYFITGKLWPVIYEVALS